MPGPSYYCVCRRKHGFYGDEMATVGLLEFHDTPYMFFWPMFFGSGAGFPRCALCRSKRRTHQSCCIRGQSRTTPQEASARHAPAKSKSGEPRQNRETFRPRLFIAHAVKNVKNMSCVVDLLVHGGGLEYEGHMAWVQNTSDTSASMRRIDMGKSL